MRIRRFLMVSAMLVLGAGAAHAQISDNLIKIGVLNDQSSLYADLTGQGSVVAARMAVEDFGAAARGLKVEVIFADHQNKADVGSNTARQWYDADKVDVIVDVPNSAVALAVNQLTRDKKKAFLVSGAASSDLTGKACSPNTIHWTYDTWALAIAKMKEMPTDDPLFGKGVIRADGRKVHDMYLFEVKTPSESKGAWDYYKLRATIPAAEAFRPIDKGDCPLVKK